MEVKFKKFTKCLSGPGHFDFQDFTVNHFLDGICRFHIISIIVNTMGLSTLKLSELLPNFDIFKRICNSNPVSNWEGRNKI